MWKPVIFRGSNAKWEKVAGGWSVSGIWNWHSGFPWNPVFNLFEQACTGTPTVV